MQTLKHERITRPHTPYRAPVSPGIPAPLILASCYSLCGAREVNQDVAAVHQVKLQDGPAVTLALAADGVGGFLDGETAAREAVMAVLASISSSLLLAAQNAIPWDCAAWLERAVVFANHWVSRRKESRWPRPRSSSPPDRTRASPST